MAYVEKGWVDENWLKKGNYEETSTAGLPTDKPPVNFLIRYSSADKTVYSWTGDGTGTNGKWSKGIGGGGGKAELKTANFTADMGTTYLCDVSTSAITVTLPSTTGLEVGSYFEIFNIKGDVTTNRITVDFITATQSLEGASDKNFIMEIPSYFRFVWTGDTLIGWKVIPIDLNGVLFGGNEISVKNSSFYAYNNHTYLVDTSVNTVNVYIPASITYPFRFKIMDLKNTSNTRPITINFITGGYKFNGISANDIIHNNGSSCEYIAMDSTYGFIKSEIRPYDVKHYVYNKYYAKGDRCYWCGFLCEANGDIASSTSFKWGLTGDTWKPLNINGTWRGMYNVANAYMPSDLVVTYDSSGTIYKFIGMSNAGDVNYDPSSGKYRDKWIPINFTGSPWMEGSTTTENGRQGVCSPPQITDDDKTFWNVRANWESPYFVGEMKTLAHTTVPKGWLLADGSAVSRTTYANLFSAIGTIYGVGDGTTTFNLPDMRGRVPVGTGKLSYSFNFSTTNVDIANNQINVTGFLSTLYIGMPVIITSTGSVPAGLTSGAAYFVASGTTSPYIRLATSSANALNGITIDLTSVGSGTHTLSIAGSTRYIGQIGGEESHVLTVNELAPHKHQIDDNYGIQYTKDGWGDQQTSCDEITRMEDTTWTGGGIAHNNMQPYLVMNYIIKY